MGRLSRSRVVHMRRSDWTTSWGLWENMGSDVRGSCGGFNMLWAASAMLPGSFLLLMKRILVGSLRVMPFCVGWTGMDFWMRARTSLIMSWPWPWRTFLSAGFKPLCSSRVWPSLFTMLVCLLGRGISGINSVLFPQKWLTLFKFLFCFILLCFTYTQIMYN